MGALVSGLLLKVNNLKAQSILASALPLFIQDHDDEVAVCLFPGPRNDRNDRFLIDG